MDLDGGYAAGWVMTESIRHIGVIGAGLMGHGIAQIFAVNGYTVTLMDVNEALLKKALDHVRANLTLMAGEGIGHEADIEPAIAKITVTTSLKEAAAGAGFIVEAVSEKLELKQNIFKELDEVCPPEVVLATNTSVISITEIAEKSGHRERIVGTHFWNPPYLIPLVEVIRGNETDPGCMQRTYDLLKKVGKYPVMVQKDVPGFVGNRLQHALWREAISIVENGIADAATVDDVIKKGFGIRLPVLGPMENADMVGLDLTFQIHDYILGHIEQSPAPSPLLKKKVDAGELGFKSGRGFQEWTPEKIQASRTGLQKYLLKKIKESSDG
jgi:3-hydroxybutyryl-CoA dehydrogenase